MPSQQEVVNYKNLLRQMCAASLPFTFTTFSFAEKLNPDEQKVWF